MHPIVTESYQTLLEATLKAYIISGFTCVGVALSLYE